MPEAFTIVISHKGEDSNIADKIRAAIESLCGESAKCFLSERITHGQEWLNELHSQLQFSKYLLLIYTDPKEDWSWCMYEAGYFSALSKIPREKQADTIDGRRIFCLHHEDLPPPRIRHRPPWRRARA